MENKHSFYATLTANVFVNDNDFDFIYECFKGHYDFTIKASAERGGFLCRLRSRRVKFYYSEIITDEDRILDLSISQIQLIMKSLEMHDTGQASDIYLRFNKIHNELVQKQNGLNEKSSQWTAELTNKSKQ